MKKIKRELSEKTLIHALLHIGKQKETIGFYSHRFFSCSFLFKPPFKKKWGHYIIAETIATFEDGEKAIAILTYPVKLYQKAVVKAAFMKLESLIAKTTHIDDKEANELDMLLNEIQ